MSADTDDEDKNWGPTDNWSSLPDSFNQSGELADSELTGQGQFDRQFYELTQGMEFSDPALAQFDREFAKLQPEPAPELLCNAVIVAPVSFKLIKKIVGMLAKQGINIQVQPIRLSPVSGLFMQVWKTPENTANHEMDELLGEERPMPREVDLLASALSAGGVPVVAIASWLADPDENATQEALETYGEIGVTGVITACQYKGGKVAKFLPGGMVISHFDPKLEDLLLGDLDPNDVN